MIDRIRAKYRSMTTKQKAVLGVAIGFIVLLAGDM